MAAGSHCRFTFVHGDQCRTRFDNPVLAAVVVILQAETLPGINNDFLHLTAILHMQNLVSSPGPDNGIGAFNRVNRGQTTFFRRKKRGLSPIFFAGHPVDDHSHRRSEIGQRIDENKTARLVVFHVGVEIERPTGGDGNPANLIQGQVVGITFAQAVDICPISQPLDPGPGCLGGMLDKKTVLQIHIFLIHPDQHSLKGTGSPGNIVGMDQHISTADINFILQGQSNGLGRKRVLKIAVKSGNRLDFRSFPRRQHHDFFTRSHNSGSHLAGEAPESRVRTQNILHRKTEIDNVAVGGYVDGFQHFKQRRAGVPGDVGRLFYHVVTLQRRQGDKVQVGNLQPGDKITIILADLFKNLLVIFYQIHFVDRQDDVFDPQE